MLGTLGAWAGRGVLLSVCEGTEEVMGAAEKIPFELQAIDAEAVGLLLGQSARTVLENIACRPDFPARVSLRPASWVAGEVLEWRDTARAGLPSRRRRSQSKA